MNVARALTVLGLIAAACANATPANAQNFPSKPIKIVVPVVPGNVGDETTLAYVIDLFRGRTTP